MQHGHSRDAPLLREHQRFVWSSIRTIASVPSFQEFFTGAFIRKIETGPATNLDKAIRGGNALLKEHFRVVLPGRNDEIHARNRTSCSQPVRRRRRIRGHSDGCD